jgi:hypothetical protein
MARKKERPPLDSSEMPPELMTGGKSVRAFIDLDEPVPEYVRTLEEEQFWRTCRARKRLREARKKFLSGLQTCPQRVTVLEFLSAHGYSYSEQELARSRGLKF